MADKNGQGVHANRTPTPGTVRDQDVPAIGERPECDRRMQHHLRRRIAKTGHGEASPPNQYGQANRARSGHAGITQSPNAPRRMATTRTKAATRCQRRHRAAGSQTRSGAISPAGASNVTAPGAARWRQRAEAAEKRGPTGRTAPWPREANGRYAARPSTESRGPPSAGRRPSPGQAPEWSRPQSRRKEPSWPDRRGEGPPSAEA